MSPSPLPNVLENGAFLRLHHLLLHQGRSYLHDLSVHDVAYESSSLHLQVSSEFTNIFNSVDFRRYYFFYHVIALVGALGLPLILPPQKSTQSLQSTDAKTIKAD
jgi:hypothetical protein